MRAPPLARTVFGTKRCTLNDDGRPCTQGRARLSDAEAGRAAAAVNSWVASSISMNHNLFHKAIVTHTHTMHIRQSSAVKAVGDLYAATHTRYRSKCTWHEARQIGQARRQST